MLKITEIRPLSTAIVVTGEKYKEDMYDDHGLIESKQGDLKTYQRVVAVGPMVRNVKVGDLVMINIMHFAVMQYDPNSLKQDMGMNKVKEWKFNWITLTDKEGKSQDCLFMDEHDLLFAFEGEEVQGVKNPIIVPNNKKIIIES